MLQKIDTNRTHTLRAIHRRASQGGADAGRRNGSVRGRWRVYPLMAGATQWQIGIAIGIVVVAIAAIIVIAIVVLAMRIAKQAATAEGAVEVLRQQTTELEGIGRINDSGVRILHSARALRKVAVGK